jgi:hypothetical protein
MTLGPHGGVDYVGPPVAVGIAVSQQEGGGLVAVVADQDRAELVSCGRAQVREQPPKAFVHEPPSADQPLLARTCECESDADDITPDELCPRRPQTSRQFSPNVRIL